MYYFGNLSHATDDIGRDEQRYAARLMSLCNKRKCYLDASKGIPLHRFLIARIIRKGHDVSLVTPPHDRLAEVEGLGRSNCWLGAALGVAAEC
jgi:hypothetical protein